MHRRSPRTPLPRRAGRRRGVGAGAGGPADRRHLARRHGACRLRPPTRRLPCTRPATTAPGLAPACAVGREQAGVDEVPAHADQARREPPPRPRPPDLGRPARGAARPRLCSPGALRTRCALRPTRPAPRPGRHLLLGDRLHREARVDRARPLAPDRLQLPAGASAAPPYSLHCPAPPPPRPPGPTPRQARHTSPRAAPPPSARPPRPLCPQPAERPSPPPASLGS